MVARSVMAAALFALVMGFDYAYVVRYLLFAMTGRTFPLEELVDSKTVFDIIANQSQTTEKRLKIDASAAVFNITSLITKCNYGFHPVRVRYGSVPETDRCISTAVTPFKVSFFPLVGFPLPEQLVLYCDLCVADRTTRRSNYCPIVIALQNSTKP